MDKKQFWLDLCWLTVCMIILFGFMLGCRALSVPDEARYTEIPREMLLFHDFITPHLNGVIYFEKPPLLYWIQALVIHWFGINEWALRAPTAFMATLGGISVYVAGRYLFDRIVAIFAAMILALSPLYFIMAHSITLDMTVSALLSITLLAFIVGIDLPLLSRARRNTFWLMYVAAALAVLAKGLIGIVLPGLVIFSWMLIFNQWRQIKDCYLISGIVIFLIIALPWHILVQLKNPEFFHFYFIEQHFTRFLTKSMGRYKPFWWFVPILIGGFFPWIVFLPQSVINSFQISWRQRWEKRREIFLVLWLVEIFIFFSISDSKLIPYIVPIFPALALLVASYLPKISVISRSWVVMASCALLLSMVMFFASGWHYDVANTAAHWYLKILAIILLLMSLGTIILWITDSRFYYRLAWIASLQIVFLWSMVIAAPHLDSRPIKPLALIIKSQLKPDDIVASYGLYYQDLPVYTGHLVKIVDWKNELTFGFQHQPSAKQYMINNAEFWHLWDSSQRVFAVMDNDDYLANEKVHTMYVLGRHNKDYLVSNRG